MTVARKRRRHLRWMRYLGAIGWQTGRRGYGRAALAFCRVAMRQQTWQWVWLDGDPK